jgi:hypothetical protein
VSISSESATSSQARWIGGPSICAYGVGCMPWPVRTNSGSLKVRRRRPSALLIAGCDRPMRRAAVVTLRSFSSASNTTSRFRSSDDSLACLSTA